MDSQHVPNKRYECHGHIYMDGAGHSSAAVLHRGGANEAALMRAFSALKAAGVVYFRDGGDALGVSKRAKALSRDYGIDYATPLFAIHRQGRYGSIVGRAYSSLKDYRALVAEAKHEGADFIKLMLSGLVLFERYGQLSEGAMPPNEMRELVAIAHGEGFRVMAHVNGADAIRAALMAGVDSVEHGYFMDDGCHSLLVETGAIWVPTLAAIAAFRGRTGWDTNVVHAVLDGQMKKVRQALSMGALVATGSDSGAVGVPHGEGILTECRLLRHSADGDWSAYETRIHAANAAIYRRFCPRT